MLNHITIMGRLTADPELRYTQSQTPVTTFRLAVDRDGVKRYAAEVVADSVYFGDSKKDADSDRSQLDRGPVQQFEELPDDDDIFPF